MTTGACPAIMDAFNNLDVDAAFDDLENVRIRLAARLAGHVVLLGVLRLVAARCPTQALVRARAVEHELSCSNKSCTLHSARARLAERRRMIPRLSGCLSRVRSMHALQRDWWNI